MDYAITLNRDGISVEPTISQTSDPITILEELDTGLPESQDLVEDYTIWQRREGGAWERVSREHLEEMLNEEKEGLCCCMMNTLEVMTPKHTRWADFMDRMQGPNGCKITINEKGKFQCACDQSRKRPIARRILQEMGFSSNSIGASLGYFDEHGGFCDCEIIFNVE